MTSVNPPAPPSPAPEQPATIPAAAPSATDQYHHAVRLSYPDIAKLAQHGHFTEAINACEKLEISVPDDNDPSRLLINVPLVLSALSNDDTSTAYWALKRLPNALASTPLPQALLELVASISERKYHNIQPRIAAVLSLASNGRAVEPELGLLVRAMTTTLQVSWRKRVLVLLSNSYASVPASLASNMLGVPADTLAAELPSWKYDAATQTFTPTESGASGRKIGTPSSFNRLDDAVAGAAHLESAGVWG